MTRGVATEPLPRDDRLRGETGANTQAQFNGLTVSQGGCSCRASGVGGPAVTVPEKDSGASHRLRIE
jgi:hypothetical protein